MYLVHKSVTLNKVEKIDSCVYMGALCMTKVAPEKNMKEEYTV